MTQCATRPGFYPAGENSARGARKILIAVVSTAIAPGGSSDAHGRVRQFDSPSEFLDVEIDRGDSVDEEYDEDGNPIVRKPKKKKKKAVAWSLTTADKLR